MYSVESEVIKKIAKAARGALFFNDDFVRIGTAGAVNKALERLAEKGELIRVARGIYCRPRISPILGPLKPDVQEVAKAIARRDRAKILPTGAMALYQLGLSKQLPMRVVYLTDGSPRSIQVGKPKIIFKRTAPKNLAVQGEASRLAIQALKEIGKDNYTEEQKMKILEILRKENRNKLVHDIRLAPEWIRQIMKEAL